VEGPFKAGGRKTSFCRQAGPRNTEKGTPGSPLRPGVPRKQKVRGSCSLMGGGGPKTPGFGLGEEHDLGRRKKKSAAPGKISGTPPDQKLKNSATSSDAYGRERPGQKLSASCQSRKRGKIKRPKGKFHQFGSPRFVKIKEGGTRTPNNKGGTAQFKTEGKSRRKDSSALRVKGETRRVKKEERGNGGARSQRRGGVC